MSLRIEGGPTDRLENHPDASYRNYTARVHLNAINNTPLIVPCHLASTFFSSLCPRRVCERDARCVADGPRELGLQLFSRATSQLSNPGPCLSGSLLLSSSSDRRRPSSNLPGCRRMPYPLELCARGFEHAATLAFGEGEKGSFPFVRNLSKKETKKNRVNSCS